MNQRVQIDTSVGSLCVQCYGDHPADVVLWSGLFFDDRQHAPLAQKLLEKGRSVALVSPPGFGGSSLIKGTTMGDCGGALLTVARALGTPSCAIGGSSWGGVAAIHAALNSTDIGGLLLFNTPIEGASKEGRLRWIPMLTRLPPVLFALGAGNSLFARSQAKRLRSAVVDSMRSTTGRDAQRAATLVLHERTDLTERVEAITIPTLVILGEEDALYPPDSLRHAWRNVRSASIVEITGTGHSSALEAPVRVADAVEEFLCARVESRSE